MLVLGEILHKFKLISEYSKFDLVHVICAVCNVVLYLIEEQEMRHISKDFQLLI